MEHLNNFETSREIKGNQIGELTDASWYMAIKAGTGEVEMGELDKALKPCGWELRPAKVIVGEVQVLEGC
jgi:hypothetical protein